MIRPLSDPSPSVRIKVSLRIETKEALEAVARRRGVSLSSLLVSAAVAQHLAPADRDDLSILLERLDTLEASFGAALESARPAPARTPEEKPKKKRWGPRLGVTAYSKADAVPGIKGEDLKVTTSIATALKEHIPVHVDFLIERFGGDKCLKARLIQLGGRKGHLFEGSITHAKTVEAITRKLDPEGLAWFPVSPARDFWISADASDFVKRVLQA